MARVKLSLPENFSFQTKIPVRITDVNYGGHVGNDSILSLLHEARIQFLQFYSLSELNFEGVGLIMSDVVIEFKGELFYGDEITALVTATDFSRIGFDVYYKLQKNDDSIVVTAKTGMVCFDYKNKKLAAVPSVAKDRLMH